MGKLKWITGFLGFVISGPIGAIIGATMGYMLEDLGKKASNDQLNGGRQTHSGQRQNTRQAHNEFSISLVILMAAVMKADGKVLKSELDYAKQQLVRLFGADIASEAILMLRNVLKQEIPVAEVAQQISGNMDYASRLQLMHLLFGVSAADGRVDDDEIKVIKRIAHYLKITNSDYLSISSMFITDNLAPYNILEIDPKANEADIKKAYRKMAVKFHPDKVAHLGDEYQQSAKEKFQKVNTAYETIKKERGFN